MKNKTRLIIALVIIIGIFTFFVGMTRINFSESNERTIATVNGYPITEQEFSLFIERNVSAAHHNLQKTNPEYSSDELDAEVKRLALDESITAKAYQVLAKEVGLAEDISFAAFMEQLSLENAQRKKAVANGDIVYGLIEFDVQTYQSYKQSNLILDLKDELAKTVTAVTDEEVQHYFDNIDENEEIPTIYTVEQLTFQFNASPDTYDDAREQAWQLCENAYERALAGESLETLSQEYSSAKYATQEYSSAVKMDEMQSKRGVYDQLFTTPLGGCSVPAEVNGGVSFFRVLKAEQCLDKEFDDMDSRIRILLESEKFDKYFEQYLNTLEIEICS